PLDLQNREVAIHGIRQHTIAGEKVRSRSVVFRSGSEIPVDYLFSLDLSGFRQHRDVIVRGDKAALGIQAEPRSKSRTYVEAGTQIPRESHLHRRSEFHGRDG